MDFLWEILKKKKVANTMKKVNKTKSKTLLFHKKLEFIKQIAMVYFILFYSFFVFFFFWV
jgi:hypothetical protein